MTSRTLLKKLQQKFKSAATGVDNEDESILVKPEISSLSVMFATILTELDLPEFKVEKVSEEAITQAFLDLDWLSDCDITWDNIVDLACNCLPLTNDDEEDNTAEATLIDTEDQGDADIVKVSLESGIFHHGFENDTFMPLVQPHTFEDSNKAIEAERINASMKPDMILTFDAALWKKWKPIAETV